MVCGVRGCIEEGRTNNRMQPTAPIGACLSAVTRACCRSGGKSSFPHPARAGDADRWAAGLGEIEKQMIDFTGPIDAIRRDFESEGIVYDAPGFYDHPRFQAIERENPYYLNNYAKLVKNLALKADYLAHAENIIQAAARALENEIAEDGRQRACIDASVSLSRMLDREGVWNYVVKGALTATFPRRTKIPPIYLWPVDYPSVQAGHVWIVAPPFNIVDVTIKHQPYQNARAARRIPSIVLAKTSRRAVASIEDICSPDVIRAYHHSGIEPDQILRVTLPRLEDFHREFQPLCIRKDGVRLKYTPVGISASEWPLERITSLQLNDRFAYQIYEEVIKPAIDEAT